MSVSEGMAMKSTMIVGMMVQMTCAHGNERATRGVTNCCEPRAIPTPQTRRRGPSGNRIAHRSMQVRRCEASYSAEWAYPCHATAPRLWTETCGNNSTLRRAPSAHLDGGVVRQLLWLEHLSVVELGHDLQQQQKQ